MKKRRRKAKCIVSVSSSSCFATRLTLGLPESSGWLIRCFLLPISSHHFPPWLYITWGWAVGKLVAAVQRRNISSTWSSSLNLLLSPPFLAGLILTQNDFIAARNFYYVSKFTVVGSLNNRPNYNPKPKHSNGRRYSGIKHETSD
jgi:hypothetical protein